MKNKIPHLPYIGGKCRLAGTIARHLKATGAETLVDVFGGSGVITLRSGFKKRIYNDADGDMVNLFRVLADRRQLRDVVRVARVLPASRKMFEDWREVYVRGDLSFRLIADPVERAIATLYRINYCFGGKKRSGGFSVSTGDRHGVKELVRWGNTVRNLWQIGDAFRNTVIECQDFRDLVWHYGRRPECVLYCDPPYFGTEDYYSHSFSEADHVFLAHALAEVPAAAVVSYYDCFKVRQLYPESMWRYEFFEATANAQNRFSSQKKKITELLLIKKKSGEM